MACIWQKYREENYYYIPKRRQSYYKEVWRCEKKRIPVNVFLRFQNIFYPEKYGEKIVTKDEYREWEKDYKEKDKFQDITNLILHYLARMDRLKGLTLEDIQMALLLDDILDGMYGEKMREVVPEFTFKDLYLVLKCMVQKEHRQNRDNMLGEVLHLIFGKCFLYQDVSKNKQILYIEQERTTYRERLADAIIFLFADMEIDFDIECLWGNEHFGIIENESTMQLDKIRIY